MELRTQRLLLREFVDSDWTATQLYESDPEVVRYQSFDLFTPERSREYIRDAQRDQVVLPRNTFDLAVTLADSGQLIGRSGLRITSSLQREGMIWFIYRRDVWGRGYATEAARALCQHGFGELGLHRIFGDCDPRNLGSIRVLEKLGMRREAHLVENVFIKDEWCDSLLYAILDREWSP